jgi:hypothetical protein
MMMILDGASVPGLCMTDFLAPRPTLCWLQRKAHRRASPAH